MQIPFTSFNFSALAKDIDSFFRTQCSGEFPPDCGPELVTSAPKLVPAVMFLPSFLSGSLPLSRARLRLSPGRSVGLTVTGGDGSGLGLVARTAHINHTPPLTMGHTVPPQWMEYARMFFHWIDSSVFAESDIVPKVALLQAGSLHNLQLQHSPLVLVLV